MTLPIRRFGGPTVVFPYGGHVVLTDPTFDPPGDYVSGASTLTKTTPAAGTVDDAGPVDIVLLSHDQHPDNLDRAGRALCRTVPLVLTTEAAAERLGFPARALPAWSSIELSDVRITAVPAQHGPDGTDHLTGPVTGFVLQGEGLPTVYVSGDNAALKVVEEIAIRFPAIDVAILFGGAARVPPLGDADLTLGAAAMVEATRILNASTVVPVHVDSWAHFTENIDDVEAAFEAAGLTDRLSTRRRDM